MSERSQSQAGQRRPVSAGIGPTSSLGGRGPTYERVQRLLEVRRARSQGQSSPGQSLREDYEAHTAAFLARTRLEASEPSPDSDDSFAFDRPAHVSEGGSLGAPPERMLRSSGLAPPHLQYPRGSSVGGDISSYQQRAWEPSPHFELPPGMLDHAEGGEEYMGGSGLDGAPPDGDPDAEDALDPQQHSQHYGMDYPSDHEEDYGMEGGPAEPGVMELEPRMPPESPAGGPSLAELEQMLNQTVMNMAAADMAAAGNTMRVPTSKDMAFGMSHGEGPFDISDIWAMDSQPSGSQQTASNRHASQSGTEASRDDGQEVNSYMGAYGQGRHSHQQLPESVSEESSRAARRISADQVARQGAASPPQTLQARLSGLQARIQANQQAQRQHRQQQQQLGHQRPQSPRPAGSPRGAGTAAGGSARGQAESIRRLQQHHAMFSAHKGPRPHDQQRGHQDRQQQHQGQTQAQQPPQPLSARGQRPTSAFGRRAVAGQGSPSGQQYRSVQPRVSPRGGQLLRQSAAPASAVAARDQAEPELTFKPRINPRSREIAERLLPVDRERRLEQLSKPRNDRLEQRYEQLRQAKEQEELRDCTFQPQTGRPPSTPRLRGDMPVYDRLYNVKPSWQLKRDDILREREAAVLANCTFQPQCGSRQNPETPRRSNSAARRRPASAAPDIGGGGGGGGGASSGYVPIHQRVADLLRSRNEKLAKAQIKMELGGGSVTFQPEINRRSVHLAAERQRQQPAEVATLPAGERLYRLAQEQAASRHRAGGDDMGGSGMRDVSAARDQRQQPSGVPAINPRSRALAESSDLPQDFLARQAYLAALGHEKRALYRSLLEESTCTFQPQLMSRGNSFGPGHSFGSLSRPGSGRQAGSTSLSTSGGDGGDRLSKLAYEDVQRSAALREALEQHHYGQYTFAPAINERSRRIGRRHSLTELHRDQERQTKLERLAAAAEAERAAECTFRPAINPRSASLGRQRRGSLVLASAECHEQANKLRSSILTEARALKEYEELKECTFTPAINRHAPKTAGPVAVPGLGRHMELRDLARRKREADDARKAEVWNARPRSPGPKAGFTIPKPFSFETRVLPWQMPRAQQSQPDQEQRPKNALAALKQQRLQQRKAAEDRRSAQLRKILQEVQAAGGDPEQEEHLGQQPHHHQQHQHTHHKQQHQQHHQQHYQQQQRSQQQQSYQGGHPHDDVGSSGAIVSYMPHAGAAGDMARGAPGSGFEQGQLQPRPALAGRNVGGGGGYGAACGGGNGDGRRRSVTFQSPVGVQVGWQAGRGHMDAGEEGVYDYDNEDGSSLIGVVEMPGMDAEEERRGYGHQMGGGGGYRGGRQDEEEEEDYSYPDSPARQEFSLRF